MNNEVSDILLRLLESSYSQQHYKDVSGGRSETSVTSPFVTCISPEHLAPSYISITNL